jgi:hypothetical protein
MEWPLVKVAISPGLETALALALGPGGRFSVEAGEPV